eukprot:1339434-Amorphochlora_amoeboformis.AAC.1
MEIFTRTQKLSRVPNFRVRAEAVYDSVGSRVTGVTICGGTRRAAGVADDGSVHAFVVDYGQNFSLRGAKKLDTKSKG